MAYPASRTPCRCAHIMVSNDPPRPTSPDLSLPSLRRGSDGKRGRHALVHDNGGGLVGHGGGALVRAAAAVTMAQGRRASVVVLLRATGTGWGGVEVQDYVPLGARRWMLVRGRQPRRAPKTCTLCTKRGAPQWDDHPSASFSSFRHVVVDDHGDVDDCPSAGNFHARRNNGSSNCKSKCLTASIRKSQLLRGAGGIRLARASPPTCSCLVMTHSRQCWEARRRTPEPPEPPPTRGSAHSLGDRGLSSQPTNTTPARPRILSFGHRAGAHLRAPRVISTPISQVNPP